MAKCNTPKWDNSARSSAVLQKASGMPFYRLSRLQAAYNVAISESTLWFLCKSLWEDAGSVIYKSLLDAASRCKSLYVDDTTAKVLEVMKNNNEKLAQGEDKGKSCHSTVVCADSADGQQIILYITQQGYCGQNIAPIIKDGDKNIMSDASTMNKPHVSDEILKDISFFNCLSHALRKFKDILEYYPTECQYFINQVRAIYAIDKASKDLSAEERLQKHQKSSSIHINNIYQRIDDLLTKKLVEPNSHLGTAMKYWIRHKAGLTKFLTVSGIELDNNRSERHLKQLILQRKNSLFFKTLSSGEVLSGLSSIIATCKANNINSYSYLNWIQENSTELIKSPEYYLPSCYKKQINETEKIAS